MLRKKIEWKDIKGYCDYFLCICLYFSKNVFYVYFGNEFLLKKI